MGQIDDRSEYTRQVDRLNDYNARNAEAFDRAILTLSSGAFVWSITFLKGSVAHPSRLELLGLAWLSFIAAMSLTIFSFLLAQFQARLAKEDLDYAYSHGDEYHAPKPRKGLNPWLTVLNCASLLFFLLGLIVSALFAWFNLQGGG